MNTNRIIAIKFTEKNVDGCGTDAEVTILAKTSLPLSEVQERLTKTIENMEKEVEEKMWDTDSVVYEACTKVFGSDMEWRVLGPDIEIIF